jgi:hypothetical protein
MEQTTTDHDEIRDWVEHLNGKPQLIESPEAGAEKSGLRISFPGDKRDTFFGTSKIARDANWGEFFAIFEDQELAFVYETNPNPNNLADSYRFAPRDDNIIIPEPLI